MIKVLMEVGFMRYSITQVLYKNNILTGVVARKACDDKKCTKSQRASTTTSHTKSQISSVFKSVQKVWGYFILSISAQYFKRGAQVRMRRGFDLYRRRDTVLRRVRLIFKANSNKGRTANIKSSLEDFIIMCVMRKGRSGGLMMSNQHVAPPASVNNRIHKVLSWSVWLINTIILKLMRCGQRSLDKYSAFVYQQRFKLNIKEYIA